VRLERLGDAAWRWEIGAEVDRAALSRALRHAPGVIDAIVTERHACVVVAPGTRFDPRDLPRRGGHEARPPREHVIGARYDGPDLAEIAARAGIAEEEAIGRHAGRSYTVALVGFMPGFAYLREVDPTIAAPRRGSPRKRVPQGAIGVAGSYTGIYPYGCPGGWNIIGTAMGFVAFDATSGNALELGDRVRFEPVT
jgi:UPF0271 protein